MLKRILQAPEIWRQLKKGIRIRNNYEYVHAMSKGSNNREQRRLDGRGNSDSAARFLNFFSIA